MPTKTGNTTTTWTIDSDNKTWTLAKNATITVNNMHGIYESGHNGSTINVLGDITAKGMSYGVYINGFDSKVFVGEDSHINAKKGVSGIASEAAGADIENHGLVEGGSYGIQGQVWSNVENYGIIRGETGISHMASGSQIYNYGKIDASVYGIRENAAGTHIENGKTGEIAGDDTAILLEDFGAAEIVNRGTIRGETAIHTDEGAQTVKNMGKIFGDVMLGEGDDTFNSYKGSVKGEVHGGNGNDNYYVGASKIKIVEESGMGSGYDDVYAKVSHKLSANIEDLYLKGNQAINGTGNGGDNHLYGNKGDNILKGGNGEDLLSGKGGNDHLTGGSESDVFVFEGSFGVDHITDWEDGVDGIAIAGVSSQADFDDLNIKQIDGSTVVNLGGGNKIIIDGLLKSDFDFGDFAT